MFDLWELELLRVEPWGTWFQVSGGCPKSPRSLIGRTPSLSSCWEKTSTTPASWPHPYNSVHNQGAKCSGPATSLGIGNNQWNECELCSKATDISPFNSLVSAFEVATWHPVAGLPDAKLAILSALQWCGTFPFSFTRSSRREWATKLRPAGVLVVFVASRLSGYGNWGNKAWKPKWPDFKKRHVIHGLKQSFIQRNH